MCECYRWLCRATTTSNAHTPPIITPTPACLPQYIEKQSAEPTGSRLDGYEMEAAAERSDTLQDLAEFQLAAVSV